MPTFRITNLASGVTLGDYAGTDYADAYRAMLNDAGALPACLTTLRGEAREHGDEAQADLCTAALAGNADAIRACLLVVLDTGAGRDLRIEAMPPTPTDNALIVLHDARPAGWILAPLAAGPRLGIIDNGQREWGIRAVACVNACAGMADPAADIAAMRATMRGVITMLEDYADGRDPASNDYIACTNLRAALALLGTVTEED